MKRMLDKWSGKYIINGKVVDNLKNWNPKKGETIKIKLLAKRKND